MTRPVAVLLALVLALPVPDASASEPLRLRVTPALAGCAGALVEAFSASHRLQVALEVVDEPGPTGADVLLADDSELTRILEGGIGDQRASVDLGTVPWVMVSPAGEASSLRSLAATAREPIAVLGGVAGRTARTTLSLPAARVLVSRDPALLRGARFALLPRSLALGAHPVVESIPALTAMAVPMAASPRQLEVATFLEFLRSAQAVRIFQAWGGVPLVQSAIAHPTAVYAQAVVDSWVPGCSLAHNAYEDPAQVLGPPDAVQLDRDVYRGLMSLGQGGWIVVDMGQAVVDGPGFEVRVYQSTSSEPVSLYAADAPSGPFRLIALRRVCGVRSPGVFSNHCDFDLAEAGIVSARYLRIEDGELYPCLAGSTQTEGADIDAVELLGR